MPYIHIFYMRACIKGKPHSVVTATGGRAGCTSTCAEQVNQGFSLPRPHLSDRLACLVDERLDPGQLRLHAPAPALLGCSQDMGGSGLI